MSGLLKFLDENEYKSYSDILRYLESLLPSDVSGLIFEYNTIFIDLAITNAIYSLDSSMEDAGDQVNIIITLDLAKKELKGRDEEITYVEISAVHNYGTSSVVVDYRTYKTYSYDEYFVLDTADEVITNSW